MTALLSNNFEQVAGMLTYAEQVSLIQHYDGIASPTPPETDRLRFPAHLAWLRRTRDLASNYASWEAHRAAWNASPATWLSHTGASASRQAALARGENLYTPDDRARDANLRALLWTTPTNNKTGWRVPNTFFWSGLNGGTPAMTSSSGTIRNANLTTFGQLCAAALNADHPAGYRVVRIIDWPLKPKLTLPGGEVIYYLRDGERTGAWPNLYQTDWLSAVITPWAQFLAAFKAAGGELNGVYLDAEFRDHRGAQQSEAFYYNRLTPGSVAAGRQFTCTWGSETFSVTATDSSAATLCTAIASAWNALPSGSYPLMSACTALAVTNVSSPYVQIGHDSMALGYGVNTALTLSATGGATFSKAVSKGSNFPHPNYPQNKTWYDAIKTDPRLTDQYIADEYHPYRADLNVIETWTDSLAEPGNRFDEQRYTDLRKNIAQAIFEPLLAEFPDCECNDYEDTLKAGDIVPSSVGSPFASKIGCGFAGGTHQSRNFYSGTNISSNTKSYVYRPSTGLTEEITRTSEVRFTVANPATNDVFKLTLEGYEVSHTVTAGQTAAQVATALVTAWNNVTITQNLYVQRYDAAVVSGAVFRLYPAGSSSTWKHEIEEVVGTVTGTGTLTKTITGYGWFPRFLDDMWRLQGMISASDKPIMPWLLPRTDPTFSFFGRNQTKILHLACMLASGGYVYYWNGNNQLSVDTGKPALYNPTPGVGDDLFDEALQEAYTLTGGKVCTPLPMPIRDGYQSLAPYVQDYFVGGRIMRLTVTKDATYRVNYQPLIATIGNKTASVGVELSFAVVATDSDVGESLTYTLSGAPSGASIHPTTGAFTWTPSIGQASQTFGFKVVVTDNGPDLLSNFEYVEVAVGATNTAPTITPVGTQSASEHTLFTLDMNATDAEGDDIVWSLGVVPPTGMVINPLTGVITWTPNETHGGNSYEITVLATDNGTPPLSGSLEFTINVAEVNTAPEIAAIPDQVGTEGVLLSYQCSAFHTDDPPQTLTFSLPGTPPSGASITSGGLFTWTPSGSQSGSYDITVRVTDNGSPPLYDETTMHVTIAESNQPPVLAAIGAQQVTVGTQLSIQCSATDPNDDDLTFSLIEPPDGATITANGLLTWTPGSEFVGTSHPITVRVTDNGTPNFWDEETVSVTVLSDSAPPSLSSIGSRLLYVAKAFSMTISATGGQTLAYSADGLPPGATLNPSTGEFSWTPTRDQVGDYVVTFNVTDGVNFDSETVTIRAVHLRASTKGQYVRVVTQRTVRVSANGDAPMQVWEVTVGDTAKPLRMVVVDDDSGEAEDLSGLTAVFRMVVASSGQVVINDAAAVVENAVSGVLRYDWQDADVASEGQFFCCFILTDGDGDTTRFPNGKKLRVDILEPI